MGKQIIQTDTAPAAIGPYSQAVIANGFVFTAGQIALVPGQGTLIQGGVDAQTRQALANLKAILEAAGTSLDNIVKTTIFLQDMNDFATVNAVYGEVFGENPPARSTIQVARLPADAAVEIEAVALLPTS
jgi:2-iminobutanoate/2-iminopropanoate deaminase